MHQIIQPLRAILDLLQHLLVVVVQDRPRLEVAAVVVKDQQEAQAVTLVVVWFLEVVVVVTIQHRPHREEALLIVIGQAIRPVPVSVQKLVTRPLGRVVLLVTARLFVVHITLQQDHPLLLLPSQALPLKKGILQQARSVIIPHHPTRQMLYTAINQPIHLAIV
jgi:hypothetical protein